MSFKIHSLEIFPYWIFYNNKKNGDLSLFFFFSFPLRVTIQALQFRQFQTISNCLPGAKINKPIVD